MLAKFATRNEAVVTARDKRLNETSQWPYSAREELGTKRGVSSMSSVKIF